MGLRVPYRLRHTGKWLLQPAYRQRQRALEHLKRLPRYTPSSTRLLGQAVQFVDAASFLSMYREIFERQIYRFHARSQQPYIIDCGANIGLSVIYFKQLYPACHVTAFEPDPQVFEVLKQNVRRLGLGQVELHAEAVWSSETTLEFVSEGADGGRLVALENGHRICTVPTVRLRDYLSRPVDLLKLDIEGAETEVLEDCRDMLGQVDHLFVEYHSFADQPQTLHSIIQVLAGAGFRIHVHPSVTSPQPFVCRRSHLGMDLQLNLFAFRG